MEVVSHPIGTQAPTNTGIDACGFDGGRLAELERKLTKAGFELEVTPRT
jgi:hypothetical protein